MTGIYFLKVKVLKFTQEETDNEIALTLVKKLKLQFSPLPLTKQQQKQKRTRVQVHMTSLVNSTRCLRKK